MPRQDYEERVERRRERLENRAEKLAVEATRRFGAADRLAHAMNGQPVLVGHHSEKRHRRDIDKMWANGRKGVEAHKGSEDASRQAAAVGSAGISADDPAALDKLRERVAALEAKQARMKAVNKAHKAWLADPESARTRNLMADLSDHDAGMIRTYKPAYSWEPHPFAPFELQNNSANLRRLRQRIAALEQAEATPEQEPIKGDGWEVWADKDDNRVYVRHDAKPGPEVRSHLKSRGFRWNRSAGAWSRMLNNAAWYAAEYLAQNGHLDG